jgi:hypothetical protein
MRPVTARFPHSGLRPPFPEPGTGCPSTSTSSQPLSLTARLGRV